MELRKKITEYRKKKIKIRKNISESRKNFRIENMFQNQGNYFKIEKNVSEFRNILLQESRKNLWN